VPVDAEQTGKPSLSLSTVFKVTPKIDVKLAWSRSFGLPALENGTSGLVSSSGQFQINENVPIAADGTVGTITVANPNLKPQTANNWDGEVSYYTDNGGKLSAAYYIKDVTDQITSYSTYSGTPGFDEVVSALGLDPASYNGWILRTSSNSTTSQRTSGWEFSASQDFAFLGSFGKRFSAFASFAFKNLAEPSAPAPVNITTPAGGVISVAPTVSTITKSSNRFGGAGLGLAISRKLAQLMKGDVELVRSDARGSCFRLWVPIDPVPGATLVSILGSPSPHARCVR
jgi:outer membrane receptor protein involved in Fe transport